MLIIIKKESKITSFENKSKKNNFLENKPNQRGSHSLIKKIGKKKKKIKM